MTHDASMLRIFSARLFCSRVPPPNFSRFRSRFVLEPSVLPARGQASFFTAFPSPPPIDRRSGCILSSSLPSRISNRISTGTRLGLSSPPSPDFSLRGPEHGMRPNAIAPISNGLSHPRTVRTAGIKSGWPIDGVAHSDGFRKSIGNRRFPAIVLDRRRVDGSRVLLTRSRREISYARCSNVFEVSVRA